MSSQETTRVASSKLDYAGQFIEDFIANICPVTESREYSIGLALLFIGIGLYYYQKFTFWSRRNVKTPTPLPFVGNALSFLIHSYHHLSHEWSRKYGKVYGYYRASKPFLVVADAKVLKQISIKDFDKFTNRYFIDLPSDFAKRGLVFKEDDHWRSLRQILTPTFTTGKIKIMYHIMDRSVDKKVKQLNQMTKEPIELDIRAAAGQISMCSTIGSLYGIDLNYGHAEDPRSVQFFSNMSREAFTPRKLDLLIEYAIPHSVLRFINFANWRDNRKAGFRFFEDKAKSIIKHRLRSGERHNDYLQLLLEARGADQEEPEVERTDEHHTFGGALDRRAAGPGSKSKLSERDVVCQIAIFMLVATETTAGLIANTLYLLAFNKRIQQRLYEQLASIRSFDENGRARFQYEDIGAHQYLDCVISESLRLMPPALYLDRKAGYDYFLEDYDIIIPKGTPVFLDFYGIMNDADYWPNPDQYDPERFSPENKGNIVPGSYCPFGIGPRHCLGFRFALTEGKLAVAKLISEFEFDVAPNAQFPPKPRKPLFIGNEFTSLRTLVKQRNGTQ